MIADPLPAAAAFELAERLRLYPEAARCGSIDRDTATIDAEAWSVIADWLDPNIRAALDRCVWCRDTDREYVIDHPTIRAALARALANRTSACTRKPDDTALADRHAAVAAIAARVTLRLDALDEINLGLLTMILGADDLPQDRLADVGKAMAA